MKTQFQYLLIVFALLCVGISLNSCTEDIPDQILVPVRTDAIANNDQKEATDASDVTEQPGETIETSVDAEQPKEVTETPTDPNQPTDAPELPVDPEQPTDSPEVSVDPEQPMDIPETPTEPEPQDEVGDVPDVTSVPEEPTVPEEPSIPEETVNNDPFGTLFDEPDDPVYTPTTYTLIIKAGFSDGANTRALSYDVTNRKIDATWGDGDKVIVYNGETPIGTLTPQSSGSSTTTFIGVVDADKKPAAGATLTLKYLEPNYSEQDGTLDHIAKKCNFATATVTVENIEGTNITTTDAKFENQQVIFLFKLVDATVPSQALQASELIVSDGTHSYTVRPASETDELFVAMPAFSSSTLSLIATVGSLKYQFKRADLTVVNGNFYYFTNNVPMTLVSFGRKGYGNATSLP